MVRGFSMESQDKRMCKTESAISGVTVDYNHRDRVYDDDCFGDILNMFDFPMESLEGDGFAEDWASKLGPIPSEVFKELMPAAPQIATDLPFEYPILNNRTSQQKQEPTFVDDKRLYPSQAAFEAPSPNSVLESRSSSSNSKGVSFGIEISIPVRTRSKRSRSATNPWLQTTHVILPNKENKKRKKPCYSQELPPVNMEAKKPIERSSFVGIKKCAHCEITKTPQWREGPMGPKTLCNACGVRYRSGRLYPEYRPAASPTFVPTLHSNSHRKVIEMRQKGVK